MSRRRIRRPAPTTDQRSPEERLEALVREPSADRAGRMLMRIRDDLDAGPEPAPWISAARTLSERLVISENAFFYFTEVFTECLLFAAHDSDAELIRLGAEMSAIERAHGLREDQSWRLNEAPEEWHVVETAWGARADTLITEFLRRTGNADVADAREQDLAEFQRRSHAGQVDLWGDDDDEDELFED